jgi:hypothetical protein
MKAVIVYRDASEHGRVVSEYLRDFSRQSGKTLEAMEPDSRDGAAFCQAYDIVEYPTIVALDDDGKLLQQWRGLPLPRITEVSYYASE